MQLTEKDIERFFSKVDKTSTCWIWTSGKFTYGHGAFAIKRRNVAAHRVSWIIANGPIPTGLCVLHNCPGGDNPACINPAHLWLGTNIQNTSDRDAKGRSARGEKHGRRTHPERTARGSDNGNATLTPSDVRKIRSMYASGKHSQRDLAKKFSVVQRTIAAIVTRFTWKHLP